MQIDANTLLIIITLVVLAMIAWSLWQTRSQLTPQAAIQAISKAPSQVKQYYEDAVIVVQWLEQISKPDQPGQPPKLSNTEKKARAVDVLKRWWPNADANDIDLAIEAAVRAYKLFGGKLPTIELTGEADILERLRLDELDRGEP